MKRDTITLTDEFKTIITRVDYRGALIEITSWTDLMGAGKRKRATLILPDKTVIKLNCESYNPRSLSPWENNTTIIAYACMDVREWHEKRIIAEEEALDRLEAEGMTRSDAQAVLEAREMKRELPVAIRISTLAAAVQQELFADLPLFG